MKPNISIITNFGCRAECWYCIWKGHKLEHVNDETDWGKLEQFLIDHQDKGKVSISGGGDPLYKYYEHVDWWVKLFEITNKLGLSVDVHTREDFINPDFWHKINRCVFSSDRLEDDIEHLRYLLNLTKLRITHLVTAETTVEMIQDYLDFQDETGCQFTIKQLIGYDDGGMFGKIREAFPDIFNLPAGDYNIYYMPDNEIRSEFLF